MPSVLDRIFGRKPLEEESVIKQGEPDVLR